MSSTPTPYRPPAERDKKAVAVALCRLDAARRDFGRAAQRYTIAQEARAEAVRAARDAGLSHDEIAGILGVTRAMIIRLDRRAG